MKANTAIIAATKIRLALMRGGHIPLPLYGKEPPAYGRNNARKGFTNWTALREVSPEMIEMWQKIWPDAINTGVLGTRTPSIDIDILVPDAADAVERLAREMFEERGEISVRFGLPPKRLIPLRTDEPFAKIAREFIPPGGVRDGEKLPKIEILANGQQFVCDGTHPQTQERYRWFGRSLDQIPREELPYVREADMRELVDAAAKLLVDAFGFSEKSSAKADDGGIHESGEEPQAEVMRIVAALAVIPNDNLDWDDWNAVGMATWRATSGADAAFAAFDAWSKKSRKYDADNTAQKWAAYSRSPPTQVGAGTVFYLADHADPNWRLDYEASKHAGEEKPPPWEPDEQDGRGGQQQGGGQPIFDPWERYIVPTFPLDILAPVLRDYVTSQSRVIGACSAAMAMATLTAVSAAMSHRWSLKMMQHGGWWEHPRLWTLLVGDPSLKKTPEMNAATAPLEHLQAELYRDFKEALRQYKEAGNEDDPEPPEEPPRYVVMDTTIQKLAEILSRTDRGLLVKRDELTGWIGDMDRYNKATHATSDRAFWLKAWDGGPYLVDRISRPSDFVENLSVSVLGGIQPDRLAELKGLTSDGLLQRFLPVMMGEASFTLDEPVNQNAYSTLIRELVDLPPQHLTMTDNARGKIDDLRLHLFKLEKASGGIGKGFQSFIGKLPGYTGRLALVLHLSEFPNERFIGGKIAENVCRLVLNFLIPHAFEFYTLGETGDQLKRLASYVLTCGKDRILASDLTTNIRDFRGLSLFQVRERASPLVAGDWLDPVDRTPTCKAWWVNPAVKVRFAEQERKEAERKRTITEMLRARRMAST